jgi:hypothetical protein
VLVVLEDVVVEPHGNERQQLAFATSQAALSTLFSSSDSTTTPMTSAVTVTLTVEHGSPPSTTAA